MPEVRGAGRVTVPGVPGVEVPASPPLPRGGVDGIRTACTWEVRREEEPGVLGARRRAPREEEVPVLEGTGSSALVPVLVAGSWEEVEVVPGDCSSGMPGVEEEGTLVLQEEGPGPAVNNCCLEEEEDTLTEAVLVPVASYS